MDIMGLALPVVFLVMFYFMLIRPQQKREKQTKEMRSNLKVGDEIITIGGIHGKVTKIKEDSITIEVGSQKATMIVAKWAVGSLQSEVKK